MKELQSVMLVDDDLYIQEAAKLALDSIGEFKCTICDSGEEALKKAVEVMPQLILLDVAMPEKDGPTTLRELRLNPQTASIPVIFLTSKVEPYEVAAYKKMGVLDIISKPFDPTHLAETLLTIWRERS